MKLWILIAVLLVIVIFLFYFRRKIIRKIKLMNSPFDHFTYDEFDSPDEPGSGKRNMSEEFIRRIDIARSCATEEKGEDFPFVIEHGGGYRTQSYNKKAGGVVKSAHTKGVAVDIDYKTEKDMQLMIKCLIKVGFSRFGIRWKGSGTSVHVDSDQTKPQYKTWGYNKVVNNEVTDEYIKPPNPWSYA